MVRIKPFRAVRPPKEHASEVASRPTTYSTPPRRRPKPRSVRCCTSSSPRSTSTPSPTSIRSRLRQGRREFPRMAVRKAGCGRTRGVLLYICADDGGPHAVRSGDVLPFRGLSLGRDQEARTDASRQGGGPHDPRPQPEGQHRAGVLRLSRRCRDRRHRRRRGEKQRPEYDFTAADGFGTSCG